MVNASPRTEEPAMTAAAADRIARLDALIDADTPDVDRVNRELVELQFAILTKQVPLTLDDLRVRIRRAHSRMYVAASLTAVAGI
jgi:hypothetical protein